MELQRGTTTNGHKGLQIGAPISRDHVGVTLQTALRVAVISLLRTIFPTTSNNHSRSKLHLAKKQYIYILYMYNNIYIHYMYIYICIYLYSGSYSDCAPLYTLE